MRNKPIQADQLIPTSSTPPPEAGFYRIDRHTIGVVGNMSFRDPDTQVVMPVGKGAIPFPGFAPRLLASLVASSTAACTSGVVTVTAASHGIPATTFDGCSFYYPGSPSLAAGWYSGFSRTSADALTFSAPSSADFTSESVSAGAAFTSEVTYDSISLPPVLTVGDRVTIRTFRASNNTASTKTIRCKIDGNTVSQHANTSTTAMCGISDFGFFVDSPLTAVGASNMVHGLASAVLRVAADVSATLVVSMTGQISAAGQYIAMSCPKMSVD